MQGRGAVHVVEQFHNSLRRKSPYLSRRSTTLAFLDVGGIRVFSILCLSVCFQDHNVQTTFIPVIMGLRFCLSDAEAPDTPLFTSHVRNLSTHLSQAHLLFSNPAKWWTHYHVICVKYPRFHPLLFSGSQIMAVTVLIMISFTLMVGHPNHPALWSKHCAP